MGHIKELLPEELHFGDTFELKESQRQEFVIVDIGEEDYFQASRIRKINSEKVIWIPGTTYLDEVQHFTGRWSVEEVIKAYRAGTRHALRNPTGDEVANQVKFVEESSRNYSRKIDKNSTS